VRVNVVARATTKDDIIEMEELLPPILRAHGAEKAKDGDSIDILDGVHFMGLVSIRYTYRFTVLYGMDVILLPVYVFNFVLLED